MVNGKIFTVGEYVLCVPLLAWHGQLHSVPWMHQESCAGEAGISTRASHPPGFQVPVLYLSPDLLSPGCTIAFMLLLSEEFWVFPRKRG